jgi:hypothetical protein
MLVSMLPSVACAISVSNALARWLNNQAGRKATEAPWWLPRWLDRFVPTTHLRARLGLA